MLFVIVSVLLSGYYDKNGVLFGSEKVKDLEWHFTRITDLTSNAYNPYYPPLFHYTIFYFAIVSGMSIEMTIILITTLIIVVMIPYLIYEISRAYNNKKDDIPVWLYVFGTGSIFSFIYWGTFPHAMNTVFVLLGILIIVSKLSQKNKLYGLMAVTPFAFFSHAEGSIYWIVILIAWLILNGYKKFMIPIIICLILVPIIQPRVYEKPLEYFEYNIYRRVVSGEWNYFFGIFSKIDQILVFWINPLIWVLFFQGIRKIENNNDKIIWLALLLPLLTFHIDIEYRAIFNSFPFICIIASRGYKKTRYNSVYQSMMLLIFLVFMGRMIGFEMGGMS